MFRQKKNIPSHLSLVPTSLTPNNNQFDHRTCHCGEKERVLFSLRGRRVKNLYMARKQKARSAREGDARWRMYRLPERYSKTVFFFFTF